MPNTQTPTNQYTCVITTVDPTATTAAGAPDPVLEGVIKSGKTIRVSLYDIPAVFRWPVVGETWMVTQRNGSWYLEGLYPFQGPAANSPTFFTDYNQGDLVLNSATGKVIVVGSSTQTRVIVPQPGDLIPSAASSRPGCLLCDGAAISRTQYADLFNAIGSNYGAGDGLTTFNIPDFRGRSFLGAGQGTAADSTVWNLGQQPTSGAGGEQAHALSISEMPAHNHGVTDPGHAHGVTDPGHTHNLYRDVSTGTNVNSIEAPFGISGYGGEFTTLTGSTGITIDSNTTGISINDTGSSNTHNILPPISVVNIFIVY